MIYSIIAMIILVTFSAYFSATETAFTSLNKIRMKNMANDGNRRARQVLELSENYDNLLFDHTGWQQLGEHNAFFHSHGALYRPLSQVWSNYSHSGRHRYGAHIRRNIAKESGERKS